MRGSVCKIGLLVLIHPNKVIQKPTKLLATQKLHLYFTIEHTPFLQDCRLFLCKSPHPGSEDDLHCKEKRGVWFLLEDF